MKRIVIAISALALSFAFTAFASEGSETPFYLETKEATNISFDGATLNADLDITGIRFQSLTYGFYWGISESSISEEIICNEDVESVPNPKFSFSAKLTDLKPKTKYWYKAFVKFGSRIFYGDIKSFTTVEFKMEAVDMGLSVKWANVNLGAARPEDYGNYFAWGEVKPNADYSWDTYKWSKGNWNNLTKYCTYFDYWGGDGLPDNKTVLEPSDDAAHVLLGGKWRMPTIEEWDELMDKSNCTWTWSEGNGISGYIVTSKKTGNSIFLPATVTRLDINLDESGTDGDYWSSSLNADDPDMALGIYFDALSVFRTDYDRLLGFSVRPVSE